MSDICDLGLGVLISDIALVLGHNLYILYYIVWTGGLYTKYKPVNEEVLEKYRPRANISYSGTDAWYVWALMLLVDYVLIYQWSQDHLD